MRSVEKESPNISLNQIKPLSPEKVLTPEKWVLNSKSIDQLETRTSELCVHVEIVVRELSHLHRSNIVFQRLNLYINRNGELTFCFTSISLHSSSMIAIGVQYLGALAPKITFWSKHCFILNWLKLKTNIIKNIFCQQQASKPRSSPVGNHETLTHQLRGLQRKELLF